MVDQSVMDRALARVEELDRLYAQQPAVVKTPVAAKAETPVHSKPKQEESETKTPKEVVHFNFAGRATDEPLFHAALDIFGMDADELGPHDRNAIQQIIEKTAERLQSTDEQKILTFISRESHKYSGGFREMRRMLAFSGR